MEIGDACGVGCGALRGVCVLGGWVEVDLRPNRSIWTWEPYQNVIRTIKNFEANLELITSSGPCSSVDD